MWRDRDGDLAVRLTEGETPPFLMEQRIIVMRLRPLVFIVGLLAALGISAYLTTPTPTPFDETMLNLRGVLETLDAGQGCVTLSGALENAEDSNVELEPPLIGLNPAAQTEEYPDFIGFNLYAQLIGAYADEVNVPVTVSLAFAYIPDTYTGMPVVIDDDPVADEYRGEPSVRVYVDAFVPRLNRRTPERVSFQFNPDGEVYLEAIRLGDVIEFRSAFDISAETNEGEQVRAHGFLVALQNDASQRGITSTPDVEATQDETEARVASCAFG